MAAPVLAVLNLKGGVGKTTIASNVSYEIFQNKAKKVLLLDMDPQYNLSQQLMTKSEYDGAQNSSKNILRLFEPAPVSDFFDVNTSSNIPPPPSVSSVKLRYLVNQPDKTISIVPGTFELTKYSFINDNDKLNHAKAYFKHAISLARSEYDLVVLDMNPSSSFLTFCGLTVATDILAPVRPDKFSVQGLELVKRLIDHPLVQPKPNLHIVMNGIKRSATLTATEKDIRQAAFFMDRILINRVYMSAVLTARDDHTGFAKHRKVSGKKRIAEDLRVVAYELWTRMGA
jgi:chromosome partitioning protein